MGPHARGQHCHGWHGRSGGACRSEPNRGYAYCRYHQLYHIVWEPDHGDHLGDGDHALRAWYDTGELSRRNTCGTIMDTVDPSTIRTQTG